MGADPVVSDKVSLAGSDLLLWIAILAIITSAAGGIAYLFFRNKESGGGGEEAPVPASSAEEVRTAKPMAAREVRPAAEPMIFLKLNDEELRAVEHSEYLRERLRELKRSLKAGEIDERKFRMEASPIMDELMDLSRGTFSRIDEGDE